MFELGFGLEPNRNRQKGWRQYGGPHWASDIRARHAGWM
jgi:hypothetical protein